MINDIANFPSTEIQNVEFTNGVHSFNMGLSCNQFPSNKPYPIGCKVNLVYATTMSIFTYKVSDFNSDDLTYTLTSLDGTISSSKVPHACLTSGFEESVTPYNRYFYECTSDSNKSRMIKVIVRDINKLKLQEVLKVGDVAKLVGINDEEIRCEVVSVRRNANGLYLYNLVSLSDDKAIINDVHHLNIMTV